MPICRQCGRDVADSDAVLLREKPFGMRTFCSQGVNRPVGTERDKQGGRPLAGPTAPRQPSSNRPRLSALPARASASEGRRRRQAEACLSPRHQTG